MMRMRALNEESSEESEGEEDLLPTVTKEAQEQETFTLYNEALKYLGNGDKKQAKIVLNDLLDSPFLSEYVKPEGSENVKPPVLMLKYSCLKNMGNILVGEGHIQDGIEYLLKATYLDGTDVTLWYKIGMAAVEVVDYVLAVDAFVECLHFSPRHWPGLRMAITMFFVTGNYMSSLYFAARALALDPGHVPALAFRDRIVLEQPSILADFKLFYPESNLEPEEKVPEEDQAEAAELIAEALAMKDKQRKRWRHLWEPAPLPAQTLLSPLRLFTWKELGDALVKLYHHISDNGVLWRLYQEACKRLCSLMDLVTDEVAETFLLLWQSLSSPIVLASSPPSESSLPEGGNLPSDVDLLSEAVVPDKEQPAEAMEGVTEQAAPEVDEKDAQTEGEELRGEGSRRARRNSLAFLEQWMFGGKRRSARVRSTARKDADDNVGHALRALVPSALLPCQKKDGDLPKNTDDSQDTMELYKLFKQSDASEGGNANPVPTREQLEQAVKEESYFSTEAERNDVKSFVENASKFLIDILADYIAVLASKWQSTWPVGLAGTFLALYPCMRKNWILPTLLDPDETDAKIQAEALATLLHAELLLDRAVENEKGTDLETTFPFEEVGFACESRTRVELPEDFPLRLYWLKARLNLRLGNVEEAISDFDAVVILNEQRPAPLVFSLPNCLHDNVVSMATAQRQITTLTRNQSLTEIEDLYAQERYEELAEILQETVKFPADCESSQIPNRHTQIAILMDSLAQLNRHSDMFYWGEACVHEALHVYLSAEEQQQAPWADTLEKLFTSMHTAVQNGGNIVVDALTNGRLTRLVQNVTHLLSHQLEAPESVVAMPVETVAPWLILQAVLARHETRHGADSSDSDDEIPASLRVLITAHDFLARRSWCCSNDGALLLCLLEVAVPRLNDPALSGCRDELFSALEQAVYCLYGHPSKKAKARSNAPSEHNVPQITLTWERSELVFRLFRPEELPEFDSYRVGCVTADVEGLLRRIAALVPPECDPAPVVAEMKEYIDGTVKDLPTRKLDFPSEMSSLYYLLADYNFKNNQSAAGRHYLLDACLNPSRLDSWAGMALARGSQLETRLNSCERLGSATDFLRRAKAVQRCYQRALDLDQAHSLLWIEFGSFVYMVHSFCCRLTKQENESMAIQTFNLIETTKEEMLAAAVDCFSSANKVWYATGEEAGVQDERWLHHYMLGKAAEKTGSDPAEYLEQYSRCVDYLHAAGAAYPCRISYNNPQNLSVEALEVYYRIHASILKYLEARAGTGIKRQIRELFEQHIKNAREGPFVTKRGKEAEEETRKRPAQDPIALEAQIEEKRLRRETENAALIGDVIDTVEDMMVKLCNESQATESAVIEISDDEVEAVAELPAPIPASDVLTRTQICDIIGVPIMDTDLEEGEVTDRRIKAELKVANEEMASCMESMRNCMEVAHQIDIEEELLESSVIMKNATTEGEVLVDQRLLGKVAEGRTGSSSSFEDTFLKFITSGAGVTDYEIEEGEILTRSSSAMEYLDETDGTIKECRRTEEKVEVLPSSDNVVEDVSTANKNDVGLSAERSAENVSSKTVSFAIDAVEFPEKQEQQEMDSSPAKDPEGDNAGSTEEKTDPKPVGESVVQGSAAKEEMRRSSQESTTTNTTTGESTLSSSSDDSSDSDSSNSSSSSDSSQSDSGDGDETVVEAEKVSEPAEPEPEELVKENGDLAVACLVALEECVSRFPQHYKALYRLARWHFLRSQANRDVGVCRNLLLGSHRSAAGTTLQGLFADRKNNNFFNGVWRIPAPEIDRPGSFACHMSRCVQLVMEVLSELRDHALLLEISVQLRRTPDSDKKYLRDSEREQLSRQALSLSVRALRAKMAAGADAALVVETYKAYRRSQKHLPHKEKMFAGLLQEVYRLYSKVQGPVLDAAIKFSQMELAAVKSTNATASPSSPFVTSPPTKFAHKPGAGGGKLPSRSRGRPPNVPRSGAATATGFQYPKASTWKQPAGQQPFPGLMGANMAAGMGANMSALPFLQMHSLFNDMSGLGGLAGLGTPGGFPPHALGGNLSSAQMLDQQLKAFNLLNYQVQMGNYQTELLRHFTATAGSTTPQREQPNVTITPVPTQSTKASKQSTSKQSPATQPSKHQLALQSVKHPNAGPSGKHPSIGQSAKHTPPIPASKHPLTTQSLKHLSAQSTKHPKITPAHSGPSQSFKRAPITAHSSSSATKYSVAGKNPVNNPANKHAASMKNPAKQFAASMAPVGKPSTQLNKPGPKPSLQEKMLAASAGRNLPSHGAASLTVRTPQGSKTGTQLTPAQLAAKQLAHLTAKNRNKSSGISITQLPMSQGKNDRTEKDLVSGLKNLGSSLTLNKPEKPAPYRPSNYSSITGYPYAQTSGSPASGYLGRSELSSLMTGTLLPQDLTTRATPRLGSEVTMTTVPLDLASMPKSITVTSVKKAEPPVETITLD